MNPAIKVLIVEDSPDDYFFFERALKKTGIHAELFAASDGAEAIQFLGRQGRFINAGQAPRPDVIFLDLKMPGANGFDVLSWMRRQNLGVRVIVLSGSEEPQDQQKALELGAASYLVKPITAEQIADVLQHPSKRQTV
jgi:CheY-like chemotaxis protein